MNVARKRRFWPLAGVLLGVLVLAFVSGALFLQAQWRWIQQRRAYLAEHPPAPLVVVHEQSELSGDDSASDEAARELPTESPASATVEEPSDDVLLSGTLLPEPATIRYPRFVLWMMGEAEVAEFDLRFTLDDSAGTEVDRARELFPESSIRWSIMAP